MIQEAIEKLGPDRFVGWRADLAYYDRDYQKALAIWETSNGSLLETRTGPLFSKANLCRLMGRHEQASAYYDSAIITYEERVRNDPDNYSAHGNLGIAYAGLGRRDDAIREGRLAIEMMPPSKDADAARFRIIDLAIIYTMLGEQDAAIDQLEALLSIPSMISVPLLKLDPTWDPLREHPRFQALVAG